MKFIFNLIFFSLTIHSVFAQKAEVLHVDTLEASQHNNFYAPRNSIRFLGDQFIYTFLPQIKAGHTFMSYGKINVETYDANGDLAQHFINSRDSINIAKILPLSNGGKVILGNAYQRIAIFGIDTVQTTGIYDVPRSFVMVFDADLSVKYFKSFTEVIDVEIDPKELTLFFIDLTGFHQAELNRLNLKTNELDKVVTFEGPRYFPDLYVTEDFVYICCASISHTDYINGEAIISGLPYHNYVIQSDYNGSIQWLNTIEDITTSHMGFCAAPEQGIYFGMELHDTTRVGDFVLMGANWGSDFLLTRVDASGHYLWATEIPNNTLCGFQVGRGFFMDSDAEFNVYMAGYSRRKIVWDNGFEVGEDVQANLPAILKYDAFGEIKKSFVGTTSFNAFFTAIDVNDQGDILGCGLLLNDLSFDDLTYQSDNENYKLFFLKLVQESSKVTFLSNVVNRVIAYPNPTTGYVRVDDFGVLDKVLVRAFNVHGECLLNRVMEATALVTTGIDIHHLMPGNYVLEIAHEGGKVLSSFTKK